MADIEMYDPYDKTLTGPAEQVLRLSGVVDVTTATSDADFDYTRRQQTWKTDGSADINALRLIGGTDTPQLVDYFVPASWAGKPNIQGNPTKDGVVFPYAPVPMRPLAADEHLVVVRVGTYFPEVWVRKGEKPVPVVPGAAGSGLTAAQEAKLDEILLRVRSLTV